MSVVVVPQQLASRTLFFMNPRVRTKATTIRLALAFLKFKDFRARRRGEQNGWLIKIKLFTFEHLYL